MSSLVRQLIIYLCLSNSYRREKINPFIRFIVRNDLPGDRTECRQFAERDQR